MFSCEDACEYHVKCYPKGYAHSVQLQTKDGLVCTFMLRNYMVYTHQQ